MELPAPTSIDGAYWYLISIIVLVATACGLYLVAVMTGSAPEPSDLIHTGSPAVVADDGQSATANAVRRSASISSVLPGS